GAVEGQDASALGGGSLQHTGVVTPLFPRLLNGQDVMPQGAKPFDDAVIEVLIRVEEGHRGSPLRVAPDESFDLLLMTLVIVPRRGQVFGGQALDGVEDFRIAASQAPPFDQSPDVDVGVADASLDTVRMGTPRDPAHSGGHGRFLLSSPY